MKDIIVIGGPNGAGKTTSAAVVLPENLGLLEFVNADNIAAGLSPFNPEGAAIAAGRVMLHRMRALAGAGTPFAFETTCAGIGHARFLRQCQTGGWRITLIFLWLDNPEIAIQRVARRVAEGGHAIPPDIILRRYWAGLRNLARLYLPLANTAQIYDNTQGNTLLIASKTPAHGLRTHDDARWHRLQESQIEANDRR